MRGKRGLGTAYKDNSGKRRKPWTAERWVRLPNGQKVRVRVREVSQEAAVELLHERVAEVRRAGLATTAGTLNDMLDQWLEALEPSLRASSYLDYKSAMRLYVRDELGPLHAKRVTTDQIGAVLLGIMRSGHMATAHKVKRLLSQAFIWGVKRGRVLSNPVTGLDAIKRNLPDPEAWTAEQLGRFLTVASRHRYFPIYYMAVSTSMRKGEILALRWSEVQGDSILIRRTTSKGAPGGVVDGAKTPEGVRRVPISDDLARVLQAQRAKVDGSQLVFPGKGGVIMSGSHVNRRMHELMEEAGVPRIRFHDLRKTSVSLLARAGVPPAVIQARLGHASPDLALKVYTKVYEEDSRRAVLDLDAIRGGISGGLPTARRYTRKRRGRLGPKGRSAVESASSRVGRKR